MLRRPFDDAQREDDPALGHVPMQTPSLAPPPPMGSQPPAPPTPQPGVGGDSNKTPPRELHPPELPGQTPDVHRPQPGGEQPQGSQGAPPRPEAPTPAVSLPPTPFEPISPSMTPEQATTPMVSRVVPGGAQAGASNLFGKAGGLLGGGIGVPGVLNGGSEQPQESDLIAQLLKMFGGG